MIVGAFFIGLGAAIVAVGFVAHLRTRNKAYTLKDPGCFFHDNEPMPDDYWMLCGECGHVFETFEDAVAVDRAKCDELNALPRDAGYWPALEPITDEKDMHCCPLCSHDW